MLLFLAARSRVLGFPSEDSLMEHFRLISRDPLRNESVF
jgi:hypothetical protein